jgi:hypothetical protein
VEIACRRAGLAGMPICCAASAQKDVQRALPSARKCNSRASAARQSAGSLRQLACMRNQHWIRARSAASSNASSVGPRLRIDWGRSNRSHASRRSRTSPVSVSPRGLLGTLFRRCCCFCCSSPLLEACKVQQCRRQKGEMLPKCFGTLSHARWRRREDLQCIGGTCTPTKGRHANNGRCSSEELGTPPWTNPNSCCCRLLRARWCQARRCALQPCAVELEPRCR